MPKPNDLIGTYQLVSKLGAGAFGEVWLATNTATPQARPVAVKIPLDEDIDLDALLQEATAWARATGHLNVLEFIAARIFNGHMISMQPCCINLV